MVCKAGKKYYIWVRGKCNEEYTRWSYTSVFGNCGGAIEVSKDASFVYDFSDWTTNKIPDTSFCWKTLDNGAGAFVGSLNGAISQAIMVPVRASVNSWLISPQFILSKTDSLILRIAYSELLINREFSETFDVLISKKRNLEDDFTPLKSDILLNIVAGNALDIVIDLSSFKGDTVYFAIVRKSTNNDAFTETSSSSLIIKNFKIIAPACPIPSNINIGEINNDSVAVSWTGSNTETWEVRYSYGNFNPNSTVTAPNYRIDISIPGANKCTIPVPERTNVVFYIRSSCGTDAESKIWTGPFAIKNCKPVTKFPYKEDFEKWSADPNFSGCWTLHDEDQDRKGFITSQLIPSDIVPSRKKSKSVGVFDNLSAKAKGEPKMAWNNWMISPELDFSSPNSHFMLDFWAKSGASSLYSVGDKLNVYVCNGLLNPYRNYK